jgi:predicted transcriptional regulator of viral defense system
MEVNHMLSQNIFLTFKKHDGILKASEAQKLGISRETLRKAASRGDLQLLQRGVYGLPGAELDDMQVLQFSFKKGVFSHESAAILYGYSSHSPYEHQMTFPQGYNNKRFKEVNIVPTYSILKNYELGQTTVVNWLGNEVTAYDREKTVLDILRSNNFLPSTKEEIFRNYMRDSYKNLERLEEYARLMGVLPALESELNKIA